MSYIHISYSVNEDCVNLYDSYGVICVRCNACGRWNKETALKDKLKMYQRHLEDNRHFSDWCEGETLRKGQEANIAANIKYLTEKVAETEELIRKEKSQWPENDRPGSKKNC